MDETSLIGMNISLYDIQSHIDRYMYVISSNWSEESIEKHQVLRQEEMSINLMLSKFIKDSTKPSSNTFKKYTELIHLVRPNHLIIKPIFAVLILKQTFPPGPYPADWHDYDELHKIWAKVKK